MVFNLDQYLGKYADTVVANETIISANKLRLLFVVDVIYCLKVSLITLTNRAYSVNNML